jgi:16S rRNA (guanine527-N7)-methyltransferase
MRDLFSRNGFDLTPRQLDQFGAYYDLLVEHNDSLDLTRLRTFEDIVVKHFIDSIYFTEYVEIPSPLIDIGSGAGFPGIPLKIFIPGLRLILSEPRKKRASFLEMVVQRLHLSGVQIYPHMVTELSDFTVQGAITRALEPIDETLTRVSHFLPRGGRVIFMKGPEANADLKSISDVNRSTYYLESDLGYRLPFTDYERRLIVFAKESAATSKTYAILKDLTATAGTAISSAENKKFKELKRLSSGEGMRKSGSLLISGKKIILEVLNRRNIPVREMIVFDGYTEDDDEMNSVIKEFAGRDSLLVMKKSLFNEIDQFNTRGPLLAADLPEIREWNHDLGPGCTLMIPFQDPANVGSAIRSAAGFGVEKIIMLKEAASPYHPKSIRASSGAVFCATIEKGPSLYDLPELFLRRQTSVVALDKGGTRLASFKFPARFVLLPGIEGPGLPEALKVQSVSIPLSSNVESLNATAALSIALYEWSRQSPSN